MDTNVLMSFIPNSRGYLRDGPPTDSEAGEYRKLMRNFSGLNMSWMPDTRLSVASMMHDQGLLRLLRRDPHVGIRMLVADRLVDQDVLREMMVDDPAYEVRQAALRHVTDMKALKKAGNDTNRFVAHTAWERLKEMDQKNARGTNVLMRDYPLGDTLSKTYLCRITDNKMPSVPLPGFEEFNHAVHDVVLRIGRGADLYFKPTIYYPSSRCPACGEQTYYRGRTVLVHKCGAVLAVNKDNLAILAVALIQYDSKEDALRAGATYHYGPITTGETEPAENTTQEKENSMQDTAVSQVTSVLIDKNKEIIGQEMERQAGRAALELVLDLPVFKALPDSVRALLQTPIGKYVIANTLVSISVLYNGPQRDKLDIITDSVLRGAVSEVGDSLDITKNLDELISKFSDRFPAKPEVK